MSEQKEAIKKGDIDAFGSFFRSHYSRLLSYCKLFVKDSSIAKDMVQETFMKLWEQYETLDPNRSIEAFLFISLRNRCLNYLRDQKLACQKLEEYKAKNQTLQFISQIDYLGAEDLPMEEYLLRELDIAIENLPDRCRNVIRLAKLKGLKNREVAVRLGISVKAVEKQLTIGKHKIEKHIRKNYPLGLMLFFSWFS